MNVAENLRKVKTDLPENITLVAVSKTKPESFIMEAYDAGHRIFGENKVQELTAKWEKLPKDIEWHMIGHLQRNKVKYIAPFVHLIESADSLKLLRTINKEGKKNERVIPCLVQVHIAKESTKFGFSEDEILDFLKSREWKDLKYVRIEGLMGMATYTDDDSIVRGEFATLKTLFDKIKSEYFAEEDYFSKLSMGMSGDYKIAIEEGSNTIRIGSLIFGERNYN